MDSSTELLFSVDSSLTSAEVASILEAGLTYVLYQRGQIPLPFQQLEKSSVVLDREVNNKLNTIQGGTVGVGDLYCLMDPSKSDGANPRERISLMMQERRKRVQAQKIYRQRMKGLESESKAYNTIRPALDMLERLLMDASNLKGLVSPSPFHSSRSTLSVLLVLGPSIYCPKEVFCFDLPTNSGETKASSGCKHPSEHFQNNVLRKFYKTIITNPDFLDFTTRPLAKTYTHICVISSDALNFNFSENSTNFYQNVVRFPSIPPLLFQALLEGGSLDGDEWEAEAGAGNESPAKMFIPSLCSRKPKNKCFRIRIHQQNRKVEESIGVNSCDETNESSSFSSDILLDNNSFSCYQIPLRFKGVACKNKGL